MSVGQVGLVGADETLLTVGSNTIGATLARSTRQGLRADTNTLANRERADLGALSRHKAEDLVASDDRVVKRSPLALHSVQVTVANTRVGDANFDVCSIKNIMFPSNDSAARTAEKNKNAPLSPRGAKSMTPSSRGVPLL